MYSRFRFAVSPESSLLNAETTGSGRRGGFDWASTFVQRSIATIGDASLFIFILFTVVEELARTNRTRSRHASLRSMYRSCLDAPSSVESEPISKARAIVTFNVAVANLDDVGT